MKRIWWSSQVSGRKGLQLGESAMADGEGGVSVANEHEQMLEEQQRLENEQTGQGEESERNEQNGGSDVPVPGVEPAAPSAPGMFCFCEQ